VDTPKEFHKHLTGDEHSSRGFHYECALRCLWLLELRETQDSLSIASGEDAKIVRSDRRVVFRQAKKKEGSHWTYDDSIRSFVERAYERFKEDPSVFHEFHTNQAIPQGKDRIRIGAFLNPAYGRIQETAPDKTREFCATVRLVSESYQPEPSLMLLVIKERLLRMIDSAYPGCRARDYVKADEIDSLAGRLLMFEYNLWSRQENVVWSDVDAQLGIERLISDLYWLSLADGALTPFDQWPGIEAGGPDNEKTRAVESVRKGRAIPRPKIESDIWESVEQWRAEANDEGRDPKRSAYKVVILIGAHGTGKTWSLMRIGDEIRRKYHDVSVLIAADHAPSGPFAFRDLALSQSKPCVILIDDLFVEWSARVFSIAGPPLPTMPLLILATAARSSDEKEIQFLASRFGKRRTLIELPPYLDSVEAAELAKVRDLSLSLTEAERVKTCNVRRLARMLSGTSELYRSISISDLLADANTLQMLGPILLFTSLNVPVPKRLAEESIGQAFPPALEPLVLGLQGKSPNSLSFEDPEEAGVLITRALGDAQNKAIQDWCERFLRHVAVDRPEERAFARRLLGRIAQKDPELCARLLDTCGSRLCAIAAQEPLEAVIFSWLPILSQKERGELLALAFGKLTLAPQSVAEVAVLIEAYGIDFARGQLGKQMRQFSQWDPVTLARFVESVMTLPRAERRAVADKFTKLLVDLPAKVFFETLSVGSCFDASTHLAAEFGRAADRKAFLYRVSELTQMTFEQGKTLKQNWIDAYIVLTGRVIRQARAGLQTKIFREMYLRGSIGFNAEELYRHCFAEEQALAHRPLIEMGLKFLQQREDLPFVDAPPRVAGSFVTFASSWGDEGEWRMVADTFIELLEVWAAKEVSFDRLASVVLPAFLGMHRATEQQARQFLRATLSWAPHDGRAATPETAKLVLRLLCFLGVQPWIAEPTRFLTRRAFLELAEQRDEVEKTLGSLISVARAALGMLHVDTRLIRMPRGWIENSHLANEYMARVGKLQWSAEECAALGRRMIANWGAMPQSVQFLTEALLRTEQIESAQKFAAIMANQWPSRADSWGYLAIARIKGGAIDGARDCLVKLAQMREGNMKGLRPHLIHWIHSELAAVSVGKTRTMHQLCAELALGRPLRTFEDVMGGEHCIIRVQKISRDKEDGDAGARH
jgi:hypothetical protein